MPVNDEGTVYLVAKSLFGHKILWIVWLKPGMDRLAILTYIQSMSNSSRKRPSLRQLGGWRALVRNPGLFLHTWRAGGHVGADAAGNQYYQSAASKSRRARRWVLYAGAPEASAIGPEWHGWLGFVTDAPLPVTGRRAWQLPHEANLTGTAAGYRPAGHDYKGGNRAANSSDYEPWTPEASDH